MKNVILICKNEELRQMLESELKSTGYSVFGAFDNVSGGVTVTDGEPVSVGDTVLISDHTGSSSDIVDVGSLLEAVGALSSAADGVPVSDPVPRFDRTAGTVTVGNDTVTLTKTESLLFSFLSDRKGELVTAKEISEAVWSGRANEDLVRFYVHSLRKKLSRITDKQTVKTSRGGGYGMMI